MKPLSEWTMDELLVCVYESHPHAGSAMSELLRRERVRCAEELDAMADDVRERITPGESGQPARTYLTACIHAAKRIRGMQ